MRTSRSPRIRPRPARLRGPARGVVCSPGGATDPVEELAGPVNDQHRDQVGSDAGRFAGQFGVEPVDDLEDRRYRRRV